MGDCHGGDDETARVRRSFDAIADLYRRDFAGELDGKPYDRAFLAALADRWGPLARATGRPVLEVGAGPAHIGGYVAALGVPMIASDVSTGQLREARALPDPPPLVAADLARLPVTDRGVAGVLAFYCLIYGPAGALDAVFAEWRRALVPDGVVALAVHAGEGELHVDEWQGRPVDVTLVHRDPDDVVARVRRAGLEVLDSHLRPPYPAEHGTDRFYLVARRPG
ncbi:MAG TPA: class I SAM-dependent methyltransferase [Acidimicrobiales bacterium]